MATATLPEAERAERADTAAPPGGRAKDAGRDATTTPTGPARKGAHLAYNPALDGIRGLALSSVLLYHGYEGELFKGSFLAVSTFFTLSGFLITSLLLVEHQRSGGIALGSFYARRLRRLLPASAATLLVVMLSALFTDQLWERALGGDVFAAGLHVANWRFIVEDRAYGDLFQENQSLVLHFWSLAIEEQFYWVFPLVVAGALAFWKGSLKAVTGVVLGLIGLAGVLTLLYGDDGTVVYYATPIRGGEILMGALLAVLVARGRFLGDTARHRRIAPLLAVIGTMCLVLQVGLWWITEQTHPSLKWGGLLAYSVTSAALVLSANVEGPVRRLMSFEPLRLLGMVSYGVYLFHWPLFEILDEGRVDALLRPFPGDLQPRTWKLLVIRLVVVLALAAASYRWFESPIRRGRRPKRLNPQLLAVGGVVGVLVVAVMVPKVSPPPRDPFELYLEAAEGPDPSTLTPRSRVGVAVGDSTMVTTANGLSEWGAEQPDVQVLWGGSAEAGCSIGDEGEVDYRGNQAGLRGGVCAEWRENLLAAIERNRERYGRVDYAVVQSGPWDVANRQIPSIGDEWVHIGQPEYDAYLRSEMEDVVDLLAAEGITVVWLTAPVTDWTLLDPPLDERPPEFDPARMELYNDMIRELAEEREGVVVVDLAAYAASLPPDELERIRPDGVHWSFEGAVQIAEDFLGPAVVAAADQEKPPGAPTPAP
ncbi:MAG TPA: acyltransferase family protein [Acidimicrobiales bacterium]